MCNHPSLKTIMIPLGDTPSHGTVQEEHSRAVVGDAVGNILNMTSAIRATVVRPSTPFYKCEACGSLIQIIVSQTIDTAFLKAVLAAYES